MSLLFIYLTTLCLLFLAFVQDVRERAISIVLFPLLLFCFIAIVLQSNSTADILFALPLNFGFLVIQLSLLYAYFWIKNRGYMKVVGQAMGWGDVLFWVIAGVLFSAANFIFFFLSSLLFSLFLHFLLRSFQSRANKSKVPLAGMQALYLSILLALQLVYPDINFHDDYLILGYLL